MTKTKHYLRRIIQFPGFWFCLLALVILFDIYGKQEFWTGYDTYFHMNTIYEDAMQIKTGHFSYFISMFGFEQSGRIVNSLYGPFFSYFCGALLLLCHSWINFEFVLFFATMVVSGYGIYGCARLLKMDKTTSIILGLMYMVSRPIFIMWITNFEFTGLGAAILLPWVLMTGIKIYQQRQIKALPLAVVMAVCLQIHMISTLIAVAMLVPLVFCGFMMSNKKISMVIKGILAAVLTVCLSGNVWGAFYDVYHSSHVIPTFPNFDLQTGHLNKAISIVSQNGYHITDLRRVYTAFILLVVIVFVIRLLFKRHSISGLDGCLLFEDVAFLWGSSTYFPWNRLLNISPKLSYMIQFPSRFITAPVLLTLLLLGRLVIMPVLSSNSKWRFAGWCVIAFVFVCILNPVSQQINEMSRKWQSQGVVQYWSSHTTDGGFRYTFNGNQIRKDLRSHDLYRGVNVVHKVTPDYLPTPKKINLHKYYSEPMYPDYIKTFKNQSRYHKFVHDHKLFMTWQSTGKRKVTVPLVKYGNTAVKLNHNQINPSKSVIGAIKIQPRKGRNEMSIQYRPGHVFKLLSIITILSWLFVIGLFIRKFI